MKNRHRIFLYASAIILAGIYVCGFQTQRLPAEERNANQPTLHLSYETNEDILSDFLSRSAEYREPGKGNIPFDPLKMRKLEITEGKFGNSLHIGDGWPISQNSFNQSGLDCDLIVATIWGEWHTKPHYWGSGRFYGDRGTAAFWVKTEKLNPGIVFLQGNVAWGRMERDLFRVDVDSTGTLIASIRDIAYAYHEIRTEKSYWRNNEWQHIAVAYDRGYGLKLYYNGEEVASNWGEDAWWQTPLPGLFSPFLPESNYDEIYYFDYPLTGPDIRRLYSENKIPDESRSQTSTIDAQAQKRLLASYGNIVEMELPSVIAGRERLLLRQTPVMDCHDERIPAWWVMDGRYELAWPHPYLLFTFILGDVDFHGSTIDIDLPEKNAANYISIEGVIDSLRLLPGNGSAFNESSPLLNLQGYSDFFYSRKIDMTNYSSLRIPLTRGYGTPPGLIDYGSLRLPLSGKTRIHEIGLWNATTVNNRGDDPRKADRIWHFSSIPSTGSLARYENALLTLNGSGNRTVLTGSVGEASKGNESITLDPFQSIHLLGPDLQPDIAIDRLRIEFSMIPQNDGEIAWLKLRDPSNPSRIWAQNCIHLRFAGKNKPQTAEIEMDIIDLMLAGEDRLWLEIRFADSETMFVGGENAPRIFIYESRDRKRALAEYAKHELTPAQMQYIKEYNYQPWIFENDNADILNWSNFGGPYDMVYPPQAVLRHEPDHAIARIYRRLTTDRAALYGGKGYESIIKRDEPYRFVSAVPSGAPSWAIWERELYSKLLKTVHWICGMQREDGSYWGGFNDDTFIPLGYSAIPLLGDSLSARSFLRLYDGMEEAGIFKDGYCDVFPIDPLHITDFVTSRGLMLAYALGNPHVFEREMQTAFRYNEILRKKNAERAKNGLKPFAGEPGEREKEPVLSGEKNVADYSSTFVQWYWNRSGETPVHEITDRDNIARTFMHFALNYDDVAAFQWTESLHHTDRQGSVPGRNELIFGALGGSLQGRIEPYPHSIAASWDNPNPDLARLVTKADDTSLQANLFNLGTEQMSVKLIVWRLRKGTYTVSVGFDGDDDGLIDSGALPLQNSRMELRRFSVIPLAVPPGKNIALQIESASTSQQTAALPDLTIDPLRDISQDGDVLKATVHNIGNAEARNISVGVFDTENNLIEKTIIPSIAAPTDYIKKTATVAFNLAGNKWSTILIDGEDAIEEIYEGNNEVKVNSINVIGK